MYFLKQAALTIVIMALIGCGGSDDKELPPAELVSFTPEASLIKNWSVGIGNGQGSGFNRLTPAVSGNTIFACDEDGDIKAINRLTGKEIWSKNLQTAVTGAVGVGGGVVAVGTSHGWVAVLSADTGDLLWKARVSSEVLAPPATDGITVAVQTLDDNVVAFDAKTGERKWLFESTPAVLTLRGTSSPIIHGNAVYAGLSTGRVVALDLDGGVPVWDQRIATPQGRSELERVVDIDGEMLIKDGVLYAVSYQGRVAAIEIDSGEIRWQKDASSYDGLAQDNEILFVSTAGGIIEAIEERTASVYWSNSSLLRRQISGPATLGKFVIVGDAEGYIHVFNAADGHLMARDHFDSDGIRMHPLIVDDFIYVFSNDGTLASFSVQ